MKPWAKKYLARLGLLRIPAPNAATLRLLTRRHQERVPFENLDVLACVPLPAEPEALVRKLVDRGHGGICYELNTAFGALLEELGFRIQYYSARIVWKGKRSPPFDHMVLRVRGAGEWLVDVGFGGSTRMPLEWRAGSSWLDGAYAGRLTRTGGIWRYEKRSGRGAWKLQYVFADRAWPLEAFAKRSHFHQTSPRSPFTQGRTVARMTGSGRIRLDGDDWIVERAGKTTRTSLSSGVRLSHWKRLRVIPR